MTCTYCSTELPADAVFCGSCGRALVAQSPQWTEVVSPRIDSDLESTRIIEQKAGGEKFLLQFSTGEGFSVSGTGLVGRAPRPEPGEFFDQLVLVSDSGRSISKTHLEFGQEEGEFWVKDRFSGNGTVIRQSGASPLRCAPERRYRVARGSRVDLGEQFFIVS